MIPETQTLIERLREFRSNLLKAMDGLDARGLNWKPTRRETNSLYVLATHLVGSEKHWLHHIVGGRAIQRDRDAEFRARGKDASGFRDTFAAIARESEQILDALSQSDLDALKDTPTHYGARSARWCILHLLEHYAEHVGQMTLTRQVWAEQARSKKAKVKSMGARKITQGTRKPRNAARAKAAIKHRERARNART